VRDPSSHLGWRSSMRRNLAAARCWWLPVPMGCSMRVDGPRMRAQSISLPARASRRSGYCVVSEPSDSQTGDSKRRFGNCYAVEEITACRPVRRNGAPGPFAGFHPAAKRRNACPRRWPTAIFFRGPRASPAAIRQPATQQPATSKGRGRTTRLLHHYTHPHQSPAPPTTPHPSSQD